LATVLDAQIFYAETYYVFSSVVAGLGTVAVTVIAAVFYSLAVLSYFAYYRIFLF
jgi:hypothetical protein